MRSTTISLALLALISGCEHKNKTDKGTTATTTTPGSATEPKQDTPPPTPTPPPPDPNAGSANAAPPPPAEPAKADAVRPPTAADLAEYTKDLPGSGKKLMAKFETSAGVINCELFGEKAPMTVANFIGLATGKKAWMNPKTGNPEQGKPYYDGLTFHRVIPEFMIQGGDPLGRGSGGPGYQFGDEFRPDDKMAPGTLAMANAGPGTNGSQFFITETGPEWLNGKHTIFGQCREVEVVKKMARLPQNAQNKPDTAVTMKVTISKG
jgi:peptidyl-prolyl cis-trans isomerase A (cyclophilin A)